MAAQTECGDGNMLVVITDARHCEKIRNSLKRQNILHPVDKISRLPNGEFAIPISSTAFVDLCGIPFRTERMEGRHLKPQRVTPRRKMATALKVAMGTEWIEDLEEEVPKKWAIHGDLVLLPQGTFVGAKWEFLGDKLYQIVCDSLGCRRVARQRGVINDDYRRPNVELLTGTDGWVCHVDNGIRYEYDVTKCMFSMGNISEKIHVAKLDCRGETVVDLFAGIGYFTLPYLVHSGAAMVHACEWNPDAIAALRRNVEGNNVADRCQIHAGDCRMVCPTNVADRVNLGLIPTSESGWTTACRSLKIHFGGILHVHGNVDSQTNGAAGTGSKFNCSKEVKNDCWWTWGEGVRERIADILRNLHGRDWSVKLVDIRRVKSYAARVSHVVADLECRPEIKVVDLLDSVDIGKK